MKFRLISESLIQGAALLILGLMSLSFLALADSSKVDFGVPTFGGSGCEGGHGARVSISGGQLDFSVGLEARSDGSLKREACTAAIPVKISAKQKLVVVPASVAGTANIGSGSKGTLNVSAFFSGATGKSQKFEFDETKKGSFSESLTAGNEESACGKDTIINLQASVMVDKAGTLSLKSFKNSYRVEDCQ